MSLLRNVAGVACAVFGSLRFGCVGGCGRTAGSLCDEEAVQPRGPVVAAI